MDVLSNNGNLLADLGLRWSAAIRGSTHLQLPAAFTPIRSRRVASAGVTHERDQRRLRHRLKVRLSKEASDDLATLVSSEHLPGLLRRSGDVSDVADFLADIFDACHVVMVVRRADHWVPSAYAQTVAGGSRRLLNARFVRSRRHLLDHISLLNRWTGAFGETSVDVLPYLETDKSDPQRIPARFLENLGMSPEGFRTLCSTSLQTRSTTSPTVESTEALRRITSILRQDALRPSRQRDLLRQAVATRFADGKPLRLTHSAQRALEKSGLIYTGIEQTANAKGNLWSDWVAQDRAEVFDEPHIDEEEIDQIVTTLANDFADEPKLPNSSAAWLRRIAIRTLRR